MDKNARILITGANGGMGIRICRILLEQGFTKIILACRKEQSAAATLQTLSEEFPHAASDLMALGNFDMNDPDKIRGALKALDGTKPLDVLFLQAGGVIYGKERKALNYRGQDVEKTVFQNALGGHVTFATLEELGLLKKSARIIVAGGEGARGIPGMIEKPSFDNAQEFRDYIYCNTPSTPYVEMNAMGVSKFVGAVWARHMSEVYGARYSILWFTPGFTAGTQGLEGIGALKQFIFENIAFPMLKLFGVAQSAEAGARKFVQAVTGQIGQSGDVLGAPEGKTLGKIQDQIPMNPLIDNAEIKAELARILEELFGAEAAQSHASVAQ